MSAERHLLLTAPPPEHISALAQSLEPGSIVCCLASSEQVYHLRRDLSHVRNVLIVPAADDGIIPWQDEFFTSVHAPHLTEASAESLRVLAQSGVIHLAGGAVTKR